MQTLIIVLAVLGSMVLIWLGLQVHKFIKIRKETVAILVQVYNMPENFAKQIVLNLSGSSLYDRKAETLAYDLWREYEGRW